MTRHAAQARLPGLTALETPSLVLDADRLQRNAEAMRQRCQTLGVALRPHLKTSTSLDVARVATGGGGPITVSTLKEAEAFAAAGYRDILYATTITPTKLARVDRIRSPPGAAFSASSTTSRRRGRSSARPRPWPRASRA